MAYLVNLTISILGIIVIPYFFSNNFTGFLLGLLITIITINILGIGGEPLNPTSSIKKIPVGETLFFKCPTYRYHSIICSSFFPYVND